MCLHTWDFISISPDGQSPLSGFGERAKRAKFQPFFTTLKSSYQFSPSSPNPQVRAAARHGAHSGPPADTGRHAGDGAPPPPDRRTLWRARPDEGQVRAPPSSHSHPFPITFIPPSPPPSSPPPPPPPFFTHWFPFPHFNPILTSLSFFSTPSLNFFVLIPSCVDFFSAARPKSYCPSSFGLSPYTFQKNR